MAVTARPACGPVGSGSGGSAAPVGMPLAAGLHASRITAGFVANSATPNLPDLLICRPELADTLLAAIAEGTAGEIGA
jgi:3'(2'), 5'-bisphosphate nucleotidase